MGIRNIGIAGYAGVSMPVFLLPGDPLLANLTGRALPGYGYPSKPR